MSLASLGAPVERVMAAIDDAAGEIVDFASRLIRIPTSNPPGAAYIDCARLIGHRLRACGFDVDYVGANGRPEHTPAHPRLNVIGLRRGSRPRPLVHLNGHMDVVPPGEGWTVEPFGGVVREGRLYGRGACDMKAGIAAAIYAAEAIRRAGIQTGGSIEISGTVDEESGGFAGMALLCEQGRLSTHRTDHVIIPEPLSVDRICVGHRGAYWFEVTTRGRTAHGSMPFLGVSAIDHMALVHRLLCEDLLPRLAERTTAMPIVPEAACHATLNVNGIQGGQPVHGVQTPCVADRCAAVFDRRFLLEEGFERTRAEIIDVLDRAATLAPDFQYELRDLLVVHPVQTPGNSPLVAALERSVRSVLGRDATRVASPGTYDHKHVARIAGIEQCVAYGPGILEVAHQPDEWCAVEDLITSTKVLALAILDLVGTA